ncbi:MAG: hypothetical protein Unbinned1007contig1000_15 [Prokaryotic dsDNA virus sp.]|nr:MAG: hypothetical protein Unbinned1007contig1000_15 [Prokaryotic dsDNA virus sp.]|tara:strand:+ start:138 stop:602 length:465 start_codon:yes stop_codon:yes gene_type:complete
MRLCVVVEDKYVAKDEEGYFVENLDYIDKNINAIQWYDTKGEIEYQDDTPNLEITDITPYNQVLTDWQTAKDKYILETTIELRTDWDVMFKEIRSYLLTECDWTQNSDNKLSDAKKEEWRVYRQKLRDMPTTKTATYEELVKDKTHSDYPTPPA